MINWNYKKKTLFWLKNLKETSSLFLSSSRCQSLLQSFSWIKQLFSSKIFYFSTTNHQRWTRSTLTRTPSRSATTRGLWASNFCQKKRRVNFERRSLRCRKSVWSTTNRNTSWRRTTTAQLTSSSRWSTRKCCWRWRSEKLSFISWSPFCKAIDSFFCR